MKEKRKTVSFENLPDDSLNISVSNSNINKNETNLNEIHENHESD